MNGLKNRPSFKLQNQITYKEIILMKQKAWTRNAISCWDENQPENGTNIPPCSTFDLDLSSTNVEPKPTWKGSRHYFYFAPYIMVTREKLLYESLQLVADLGGYVGVITGVSFLHGLDLWKLKQK